MQVNPFLHKPWFLHVYSIGLLKTRREKEKLLVTSNFSFSHSVLYHFGELSSIFIKVKIVVYKLSVWKSLKFVVWERVNSFVTDDDTKSFVDSEDQDQAAKNVLYDL